MTISGANTIELAVSIAASDTATVTAGGIGLVWSGSDATTTEGEMAALADEMEAMAESMDRVLYLNLRERAGSGPMVASRLLGSDRVHLTNPVGYATIAGHVAAMLREAAARADVAYTPSELIAAIAASSDINTQQQANVSAAIRRANIYGGYQT